MSNEIKCIDIMKAFTEEPPQLDFIWPGFLSGTVGALVAPGATGKSFWALEAAMAVACDVEGGDVLNIKPSKAGQVIYFAGEDPESVLIRRIHAIGESLSPNARAAIAKNLNIQPTLGKGINVINSYHRRTIVECCKDARLIVFDTLSRFHDLDENSNGDMAHLVNKLEYIAAETGAAVLFLHHVSKASAREAQTDLQHAARGASSLIDNSRWCGFVAKMTEEESKRLSDKLFSNGPIDSDARGLYVRFGISKQNYDVQPLDQWYKRKKGGVLVPVDLSPLQKGGYRGKV